MSKTIVENCPVCNTQRKIDVTDLWKESQESDKQTIREHARVIANSFCAIDILEGILVESHDLILRLITTFVSDQDGAYQQACDLMRKIRETCPDKEFAGGKKS